MIPTDFTNINHNTWRQTQRAILRVSGLPVNVWMCAHWRGDSTGHVHSSLFLTKDNLAQSEVPSLWYSLTHRLTVGMSQNQGPFPHTQQWNTFAPKEISHLFVVHLLRDKYQTWTMSAPLPTLLSSLGPVPFPLYCFLPFVFLYLAVLFDLLCDKFQLPLMFMYSMFLFPFGWLCAQWKTSRRRLPE